MGTRGIDAVAQITYDKIKNQKAVQHYPIQESITAATAALKSFDDHLTDVDTWKPVLEIGLEVSKLRDNEKSFREAIRDLEEYRVIMSSVKVVAQAANASKARKLRLARDVYTSLFREVDIDIPDCVIKVAGDMLYARHDKPGSLGISVAYASALLEKTMSMEKETYCLPRLLLPPDDIEDKTLVSHHHTECYKRISENIDVFTAKGSEGLVSMRTQNHPSACGSVVAKSQFQWNSPDGEDGPKWFDAPKDVRVPVICQWVGHCCPAFRFFAYRLHQHFLHVIRGTCCIIVVPGSQIEEQADIFKYLKGLPATALAKCPAFTVQSGSSLWVPFGYFPLVIGAPTAGLSEVALEARKEQKSKGQAVPIDAENVLIALSLCYDSSAKEADETLRLQVLSSWTRARSYVFHGIKESMAAWLKDIEPVAVVP